MQDNNEPLKGETKIWEEDASYYTYILDHNEEDIEKWQINYDNGGQEQILGGEGREAYRCADIAFLHLNEEMQTNIFGLFPKDKSYSGNICVVTMYYPYLETENEIDLSDYGDSTVIYCAKAYNYNIDKNEYFQDEFDRALYMATEYSYNISEMEWYEDEDYKKDVFLYTYGYDIDSASYVERLNNKDMLNAYSDIIEKYYLYYLDALRDFDSEYDETINCEFAVAVYRYDAMVQAVYDLNHDGVQELFIGLYDFEYDKLTIYDVYTYQNNKAIQLMEDIGDRIGTCIICENGIIEDRYSGSVWEYGVTYRKLPKNGTELEAIQKIWTEMGSTVDEIIYYQNKDGNQTIISEEKFNEIQNSYSEYEIHFTEVNELVIEGTRNGIVATTD